MGGHDGMCEMLRPSLGEKRNRLPRKLEEKKAKKKSLVCVGRNHPKRTHTPTSARQRLMSRHHGAVYQTSASCPCVIHSIQHVKMQQQRRCRCIHSTCSELPWLSVLGDMVEWVDGWVVGV